jgi:hypothetical protein
MHICSFSSSEKREKLWAFSGGQNKLLPFSPSSPPNNRFKHWLCCMARALRCSHDAAAAAAAAAQEEDKVDKCLSSGPFYN